MKRMSVFQRLILFAFAFLASGYFSGFMTAIAYKSGGAELWYIAGVIFGVMFVLINGLLIKKPAACFLAVGASALAHFFASLGAVNAHLNMAIVGLVGAGAVAISFTALFGIRAGYSAAAVAAGILLALLMYITDIDHRGEMARTYALWQCAVGTLLSLGLKKEEGNSNTPTSPSGSAQRHKSSH